MKAEPIKSVQLNFEYRSRRDLRNLLTQIEKELVAGEMLVKSNFKGYPYIIKQLNRDKADISPSRIETINGNNCEIYQSKMNGNG